jgi:hypothetical protein
MPLQREKTALKRGALEFVEPGEGGVAPYGDDPRDQTMISAGIKHYRGRQW